LQPGVGVYKPGNDTGTLATRIFRELPPLALYLHIPWCIRKCPYCDFNSHEQKTDSLPEDRYIDALLADLALEMPDVWGRTFSSVFIGGGTPSLFSPEAIEKLLSGVRALTALPPDAEITMEANPGTVEQQRFREFRDAGINRLSIGIQSFSDVHLEALGRVHGRRESLAASEIAHAAGFDNFNLDLMYGLPGQSLTDAQQDLQLALDADPTHLSYYQLTLEPNTLFYKFPPKLPDHDSSAKMQENAHDLLGKLGFERYEVSAWSKPARQCRHNLNYWQFGDYLGVGAGAHGKITNAADASITRRAKIKHPERYLASAGSATRIDTEHQVAFQDTAVEFMMNALRLVDGFSPQLFREHTGLELHLWNSQLEEAVSLGLLEYSIDRVRASEQGMNFLDDLVGLFEPTS